MQRQVRRSRLLVILTAVVTAMTLIMPVGMARAATASVTAATGQVLHRGANTVTFNVANSGTEAATYTPTVTGPSQFSIVQAAPVTVAGGAGQNFSVGVTVPQGTDPANFTLSASVVSGTDTSTGSANLPLTLLAGQNRSMPVTIAAGSATASSQQPAEPIGNAFDGRTNTVWHTPWNVQATPWPATITIDLGAEIDLAGLEVVPRQSGGSNGRWNAYEVALVNGDDSLTKVAEGNMPDTAATKVVALTGKASKLRITIRTSYGDTASMYASVAEIRVLRAVADDAIAPLPVTLVGAYPNQATFPPANLLDHDTLTYFHTPYMPKMTAASFPYNVDLSLGNDPVDLSSFVMVPKGGTAAGDNNGRPGGYTILAGNTLDSLVPVTSGTFADSPAPKTIDLSDVTTNYKFLRLAVTSTYGDGTANQNAFVAISELKVYGTAVPVITDFLEASLTRTDTVGATVHPGDVLKFDVSLKNLTSEAIWAVPGTTNLSGVDANCLKELAANATVTCAATHTVTQADLTAETFTPAVQFDAAAEEAGTTTLQADVSAALPAITVVAAPITEYLDVAMTRTDAIGATARPGDVLTFNISYSNLTGAAITAFPRTSNLTGVLTTNATTNCRYENLPANTTKTCTTATHTVTEADVTGGNFTPTVSFDATSDRAGTAILQAGVVATLPAITVQAAGPVAVGQWVPSAYGQIRIESVSPAKATYSVGDVVTVVLRMESNATAPKRDVTGASTTLSNPSSCDWKAFPAGVGGKYNCARTGMPALTYTVTAADAAAGVANFSLTYTETPVDAAGAPNGASVTSTIRGSLPAAVPSIEPRADGVYVALASAGDYGFTCHRIPALTTAPNGDILASWDGRPGGCGDAPQANSIIQRRSTDGGQTWGAVTTVAAGQPTPVADKFGYSDPSYVVDREMGKIFNFFVKSFDQGWGGSVAGTSPTARNVIQAAVTESTDNGLTWSTPRVITEAITADPSWTSRFAASGEGIQLKYAPHKGRLVQQFTVRVGSEMQAVSVYSDDHGVTWEVGTPVGTGMDENKVVELSDGRVMLNSRPSSGPTLRKVAISTDGGVTYGEVTSDATLIDPRNNASIIRAYPNAAEDSAKAKVLLFSNAANTGGRSNGTIRVSFDDGQTWSGSKVFEPGAMSYSTLTPLPAEGKYGLLFEGANNQIRYMTISMEWLGVLPLSITAEGQTVNRGTNTVTFSATNLAETAVTFTPTFTLPGGWTADTVAPVTIAAGATGSFTTTVTVPSSADPGNVSLAATATIDGKSAIGTATLTMALKPGQNPTKAITVTPVNTPPAQPGQGIANAFDGDTATLWHTPYAATVGVPVDVDMKLGDAPVQDASLEYVPRASGSNGTINGYEVWGGDSIATLAKVAEGNFVNSNTAKVVPLNGTYQYLRLRAISSYGDTVDKWVSAAEIRVKVGVADTATSKLPLTLENELTYQNNPPNQVFPPSNMFDGNATTWFHSPWAATQTFPYNIDLSVGDNGAVLDRFVFTPKSGGTAPGDNNGRPLTWKILVGDSLDALTEVKSGTWADNNEAKTVPLDGVQGKFVRLQILTTAGDTTSVPTSPQTNKYVAVAEIAVFGTAVPAAPKYLTVSLERTDAVATPVKVGDTLTFKISFTNTSDRTITAFPRSSNLDGVLVGATPNCRWGDLVAGDTKECGTATHTVTAADLEAGSFTPTVRYDATADREGTEVLQKGIVATLPAIEVKVAVDPADTPTPSPTVTVTAPEVTATSTATQTATSTATQTATSTATATATATTTATVTSTATATSTNTATATSTATATATVTTTATATVTAAPTTVAPTTSAPTTSAPTTTPTVKPTVKPTAKPTQRPVNVYTDPGYHTVNGRQWFTKCEPYSATTRCFTEIWASQVKTVNGIQQWVTGWTFNNLTYLPMARETWQGNKLAFTNEWTATDGRKWKTECDTAQTGSNGCRSYTWSTVYEATSPGARTFRQVNKWVFNNIVMFS